MAVTGYGGFTSRLLVGADRCITIPDGMPTDIAGAFAFTYATGYHAARRSRAACNRREAARARCGRGRGYGSGRDRRGGGAEVIAAASTDDKLALCEELGAAHGINYATEDLKKRAKALGKGSVDVVYDPVGGDSAEAALRALGPGGRHLVIGFASGTIPRVPWTSRCSSNAASSAWPGARGRGNPAKNADNMRALFELYGQGKLAPRITARYGLAEVPAALAAMHRREVKGKVIIEPQR